MGVRNFVLILFIILNLFWGKSKASFFNRKEKTIHIDKGVIDYNQIWSRMGKDSKTALMEVVRLLGRSSLGKKIIKKAEERANSLGLELMDIVYLGETSITDTTLIRKFSQVNPEEVFFETRSKVYLDKRLTLFNAILDLAHELTHFSERAVFNPYDKNFSLKDFIRATIEGEGGEIEAYLKECQVLKELFPQFLANRSNCLKVYDEENGIFSKEIGKKYFYRVGQYYTKFENLFYPMGRDNSDFPYISDQTPIFISSAHGLPYPVAAILEYNSIVEMVCKNDKNRYSLLKEKMDIEVKLPKIKNKNKSQKRVYRELAQILRTRCQDLLTL